MNATDIVDELDLQEILTIALLDCAADSLLPEMIDCFSHEHVLRFLEIFGGCTITVPEPSVVINAGRNAAVWRRVEDGEEVADLSVEYDLEEDDVEKIHSRMTLLVEASAPYLARQQRRHRAGRGRA